MPGTKGRKGDKPTFFGSRKRKFNGNRFTAECDTGLTGASCSKIKNSKDSSGSADPTHQYVFISFACIFGALSRLLKCKSCDGDIRFEQNGNRGLGFQLCVICDCPIDQTIDSCPTALNPQKNNKIFEINRKIVFVMRLLGVGFSGLNLFCAMMDLSSSFSQTLFDGVISNISIACKTVFDRSIKNAVDEEIKKNVENGKPELILTVSGDGTWAKRGYSSLLGVITLIGKYSGKVVDAIVKNSFCIVCAKTKKMLSKGEFAAWYEQHKDVCKANHTGSAGKMEVDGVYEMFQRSVELHDVKYGEYIGDGDNKTFPHLLQNQPYGADFTIHKLECILHVGERMFKRLKELKKKLTAAKNAQKQHVKKDEQKQKNEQKGGATKSKKRKSATDTPAAEPLQNFTDKVIREMSTYYALAIQRHGKSVEEMKKEIMAGFYHKISTNDFPQHEFCDIRWCKYMQHTAAGIEFEHPPPLDPTIQAQVKQVYESLTKEDLLERCLSQNTQNNNESYNSCLWQLAPKHLYHGKDIIEIATWTSAAVFNDGSSALLLILKGLGVRIGPIAWNYCKKIDDHRKHQCHRRSTEFSKEGRVEIKKKKQDEQERFEEEEGLLYGAGIAD